MKAADHGRYLVRMDLTTGTPPLALLRDRIDTLLPERGVDLVSDLQLVATELVTNAYVHGRPPIEFTLSNPGSDGLVRIEVTDCGPAMPKVRHPDLYTPHGRGLLLVAAYSVRWGVVADHSGKTVWAELR